MTRRPLRKWTGLRDACAAVVLSAVGFYAIVVPRQGAGGSRRSSLRASLPLAPLSSLRRLLPAPDPSPFGPASRPMQQAAGRILLTGATGYVGGRLLRKLEESGRPVRCMVRRPDALSGRATKQTEIVYGDVLEAESLHEAFAGVTAAYYLVHSMAASGSFADADRRGAENFATAARRSGLSKIV
jgi:NAD(P)H-binding